MKDNNAKWGLVGLGIGIVAGVVAGVLLAPKSGKDTIGDMKKQAEKAKDTLEAKIKGADEEASKPVKKTTKKPKKVAKKPKKS